MKFTAAKAKVAAIGNILAAVQVFLAVLLGVLSDDAIGVEEVTPLVTGLITLGLTVYGVWNTENKPLPAQSGTSYH